MAYKYTKQLTLGYDQDGKRIRKRIYANSQQELKRKETEMLRNSHNEMLPEMTLGKYAQKWFETYKSNTEQGTQDDYQKMIKKLEPLANYQLKNIRRTDLQAVVNNDWEHPTTCRHLCNVIRQIFASAFADGLIQPFSVDLQRPKVVKKEKRILSPSEKAIIKNMEFEEPEEKLFIDLEFYLGLRPEETRALSRNDFNWKKNSVSINKAYTYSANGTGILKGTKTDSTRILPMPDALVKTVKGYLNDHNDFYLFFPDGELITKSKYYTMYNNIRRQINVALGGSKEIKVFTDSAYIFRHSRATELYYTNGISTKLKAKYMGHSEEMFLKIYSHLDESIDDMEILRGNPVPTVPKLCQDTL